MQQLDTSQHWLRQLEQFKQSQAPASASAIHTLGRRPRGMQVLLLQ